jgi:selenide,water dikinase
VLEGSRSICIKAGIPLAGGHSIDCPEPVFGLAVTGKLKKEHLKQNNTAKENALLYLTKPLGIGIVTTAQKKGIVNDEHLGQAIDTMLTLNTIGAGIGKLPYVSAMTDVTGFGLLGHLCEMCEGSGLSAEIIYNQVPKLSFLDHYIAQKSMPGGTTRNLDSYGHKISAMTDEQKAVLADPQTSGGLLVAVDAHSASEFEQFALQQNLSLKPFGKLVSKKGVVVEVH